jgi:hypothetical protein
LRRRAGRGNGDACGGELVGADRRSLEVGANQALARFGVAARACELASALDADLAKIVQSGADRLSGRS